jgi:hypothetical protein
MKKTRIARNTKNKIQSVAAAVAIFLALANVAQAYVKAWPSFVRFGNEPVGSTSAPHHVTIKNENRHRITISSVTSSTAQFSFSEPGLPVVLDPGQTLTVAVRFKPSAAQAYSGKLEFMRSNGWPISVALMGTGTGQTQPPPTSSPVAPTISTQPANVKIVAGQSATFSIGATGTAPMTYQWKKNGALISGANSAVYTTPAEVSTDNNAQFTVAVSNSAGNATSNAAVLTVTSATVAPAITTQPASQAVIAGKTASFTVAASGTAPLMYQWSKNGTPIGGANSPTYTTPAEVSTDNNAQFTVAVSNSAGNATSNAATLTVSASTLLLNSSASALSFGSVTMPNSGTQTVTLTNAGNSSVTISNVTVSGAGFNATGVSGVILNPGQTAALTATFAPAATGPVTGKISVASTATNSPDVITLSGTGVAAPVSHSVALTWTPSVSTVVGYNAYSSQTSGGPYTKLTGAPVAATSYTDASVQSGQTYYFVVTSVDASNLESAFSGEVSALIP